MKETGPSGRLCLSRNEFRPTSSTAPEHTPLSKTPTLDGKPRHLWVGQVSFRQPPAPPLPKWAERIPFPTLSGTPHSRGGPAGISFPTLSDTPHYPVGRNSFRLKKTSNQRPDLRTITSNPRYRSPGTWSAGPPWPCARCFRSARQSRPTRCPGRRRAGIPETTTRR